MSIGTTATPPHLNPEKRLRAISDLASRSTFWTRTMESVSMGAGGILSKDDIDGMCRWVEERGGFVNKRDDGRGGAAPYTLDLLSDERHRNRTTTRVVFRPYQVIWPKPLPVSEGTLNEASELRS